ncbi:MAG: gamma-glutamylcyclotransferase [Marinosulfonomonas sp.]|nr:gamma-glutamylcyclotransferase [Marinosulfonomonas sp.]
MKNQFIFGYGSLVNQATHDYETSLTARLSGWKRIWRHTETNPVAFLTTEPDVNYDIDGLIIQVAHENPALELREQAYKRADVSHITSHDHPGPTHIHTYTLVRDQHGPASRDRPILLSYLDVVVQGYFREFGEDGVQHFFETTEGWDTPVLDDRADPSYPRHQKLMPNETGLTDSWLAKLSAVVK